MANEDFPECVRCDCAANDGGRGFEIIEGRPCKIAGLLLAGNPVAKKMPRTREEFRMAANWLARQAAKAGNALSAALAGPAEDDEENGICLGYRDGRDRV
jgi:hypothetical protein